MMLVIYIRIKKSDGPSLSIKPDEMSDEKPVVHDALLSFFSSGLLFRFSVRGHMVRFRLFMYKIK